MVINTMPNC